MTALAKESRVAIIGAGTMGAGIAQVAAQAGHCVDLYDMVEGAAAKAIAGVCSAIGDRVKAGKFEQNALDGIAARLRPVSRFEDLAQAALFIEAIAEDLGIKRVLFAKLEALAQPQAIIATNTSTLSVTAIAAGLKRPERLVGMHFFNPAPVMRLVEVVQGIATSAEVLDIIEATAKSWGKHGTLPFHAWLYRQPCRATVLCRGAEAS